MATPSSPRSPEASTLRWTKGVGFNAASAITPRSPPCWATYTRLFGPKVIAVGEWSPEASSVSMNPAGRDVDAEPASAKTANPAATVAAAAVVRNRFPIPVASLVVRTAQAQSPHAFACGRQSRRPAPAVARGGHAHGAAAGVPSAPRTEGRGG